MSNSETVPEYETVNLQRAGAVARIEFNRPEKMNAWNKQFGLDLRDAVERAGADPEVRAVVLSGAGRGFSSGADLSGGFEPTPEGLPDLRTALVEWYHPIILGVREMPKPVIAAVHGPAVGIGCSLALAADFVLAAESAYFLLAFVNIGLVPDGGSSAFIPARIGLARATELAMLGERLPAPRALEWGLINAVHADDELPGAADALAERLAAGPTKAYAGAKRQLNAWVYRGVEQQLELEAGIQQEQAGTADFQEGALAFLQKRAPVFRGI